MICAFDVRVYVHTSYGRCTARLQARTVEIEVVEPLPQDALQLPYAGLAQVNQGFVPAAAAAAAPARAPSPISLLQAPVPSTPSSAASPGVGAAPTAMSDSARMQSADAALSSSSTQHDHHMLVQDQEAAPATHVAASTAPVISAAAARANTSLPNAMIDVRTRPSAQLSYPTSALATIAVPLQSRTLPDARAHISSLEQKHAARDSAEEMEIVEEQSATSSSRASRAGHLDGPDVQLSPIVQQAHEKYHHCPGMLCECIHWYACSFAVELNLKFTSVLRLCRTVDAPH